MSKKLDAPDLEIIRQLQINPRSSVMKLTAATGASRQTIAKRLNRILGEGLAAMRCGCNLRQYRFKVAEVGLEVRTERSREDLEKLLRGCPRVLSVFRTPEKANIHVCV